MTANLARALLAIGVELGTLPAVSVKPKRGEGLDAIGHGDGIAVWAVALLDTVDGA